MVLSCRCFAAFTNIRALHLRHCAQLLHDRIDVQHAALDASHALLTLQQQRALELQILALLLHKLLLVVAVLVAVAVAAVRRIVAARSRRQHVHALFYGDFLRVFVVQH